DFNNQLATLMLICKIAEEKLEPGHSVREEIAQIMRVGEQAASLTRQLLAFSRKQVLHPRLIRPDRVVSSVESILSRLLGEQIRRGCASECTPALLDVEPDQLGQALVNLASNSRDAMPEGGRLTIQPRSVEGPAEAEAASGARRGRYVLVRVSDSGIGMTDE